MEDPLASPDGGMPAAREFLFDDADFSRIAAMMYSDAGIYLSHHKTSLVYGRLVKRLRAIGLKTFKDYCDLIEGHDGVGERQKMLSALTTNVTSFFREQHHFDYLRNHELPKLIRAARSGARIRIWSAGCSKGHEPFSIAMTLLSLMPDANRFDIKILATDIDPSVIDIARRGQYEAEEVANIPVGDRNSYFEPAGAVAQNAFVVGEDLRNLVSFRELNLMGPWPMRFPFQVLFCRNVTIYFDAATQAEVWRRFESQLEPGGLMCIGHSERLSGPAQARFNLIGTTTYRHVGEKSK